MTNQIPIIEFRIIKRYDKPEDIFKMSHKQNKQSREKTYYKVEKPRFSETYQPGQGYAQAPLQII